MTYMIQFPHEVNVASNHLTGDVLHWCNTHMGHKGQNWVCGLDPRTFDLWVSFRDPADATAFALVWSV
jgi:hypothetical protein